MWKDAAEVGTWSLNPIPFIRGLWKDLSAVCARQWQMVIVAGRTAVGFARFQSWDLGRRQSERCHGCGGTRWAPLDSRRKVRVNVTKVCTEIFFQPELVGTAGGESWANCRKKNKTRKACSWPACQRFLLKGRWNSLFPANSREMRAAGMAALAVSYAFDQLTWKWPLCLCLELCTEDMC